MLLITGAHGRLGQEVRKLFKNALAPSREELDITDALSVFKFIEDNSSEMIIHLAALTDVRRCEMEKALAYKTNVLGTENLVNACLEFNPGCYFVYMSTAAVFDGEKGDYTEDDIPTPKNFYGLTKLLGELVARRLENHLIIRGNFVLRERWPYKNAFADRFGTYLFADDLAKAIREVIEQGLIGVVHIAGEEKLSMSDLAKVTTPNIRAITMEEVDTPLTKDMSLRSVRVKPYRLTR